MEKMMRKISPWTMCLLLMLGAFAACEKNVETTKENAATLESSVDATVVTLTGSIVSPLTPEDVTDQYFLLSEDEDVPEAGSVKIPGVKDSGNKMRFSGQVENFTFGSIYYYKAVVVSDGKSYAGNVRSFRYEVIPITELKFEKEMFLMRINGLQTIYPKVTPKDATYRNQLSFTSNASAVAGVVDPQTGEVVARAWGTATLTVKDVKSGKEASCQVKVMEYCPSGAGDLGLSVYWGEKNLGATNVFQPGDYYAYGETTPKTSFSSSGYTAPKYENGVLPKANDAAAKTKGGHWRMPTEEECDELIANCTVTLGFNSTNNRYYAKVRSKINGYEIWLPLGGNYSDLYGGTLEYNNVNLSVYTADGNHLYSRNITGSSKPGDEVKLYCNGFGVGYYGRNVRPVTD